jgi:hypothetical protein
MTAITTGSRRHQALVRLELITGGAALAGGALLAAAPDGSLLFADVTALEHSPFTDWRLPGLLLAVLVGIGYLATGAWERRAGAHARELSIVAGAGLVVFEGAEVVMIGFHPLEVVFALVGLAVVGLAVTSDRVR